MRIEGRRTVQAECLVDIERTAESLHAHAIPDGVEIRPGDTVIVHGAPPGIRFGERVELTCRATVLRAGPLTRAWVRLSSLLALTELYEVGFQPKASS